MVCWGETFLFHSLQIHILIATIETLSASADVTRTIDFFQSPPLTFWLLSDSFPSSGQVVKWTLTCMWAAGVWRPDERKCVAPFRPSVPITEWEKEAHHEKPTIAVVEDVDVDVNLGNVILERFGENDERGVVVAQIHEIHRGRGRTVNLLGKTEQNWDYTIDLPLDVDSKFAHQGIQWMVEVVGMNGRVYGGKEGTVMHQTRQAAWWCIRTCSLTAYPKYSTFCIWNSVLRQGHWSGTVHTCLPGRWFHHRFLNWCRRLSKGGRWRWGWASYRCRAEYIC